MVLICKHAEVPTGTSRPIAGITIESRTTELPYDDKLVYSNRKVVQAQ